jgi:fibronectin type 3 domain-containing protein
MKKSTFLAFVSVTLLAFLGACGNDGGQTGPVIDTVPPNPPVGLEVGDGGGFAKITWTPNAEIDLAGYRVYRSAYEDGSYRKASPSLLLCPWFYDDVTPGGVTFYKVTAVDDNGNESAYSQIVGIYWNSGDRSGPSEPAYE